MPRCRTPTWGRGWDAGTPCRCDNGSPSNLQSGAYRSSSLNRTLPSTRASGIRSFMRLKHRNSVLLPQPEGPIIAVTRLAGMLRFMSRRAKASPYFTSSPMVLSFMGLAPNPLEGVLRRFLGIYGYFYPGLQRSVSFYPSDLFWNLLRR